MALVGGLLAEERRSIRSCWRSSASALPGRGGPACAGPWRQAQRPASCPASADLDALASMLIGSFYAWYLLSSDLPADWAERTLQTVWPIPPAGAKEN